METRLDQLCSAFSAIDAVGRVLFSALGALVERKKSLSHPWNLLEGSVGLLTWLIYTYFLITRGQKAHYGARDVIYAQLYVTKSLQKKGGGEGSSRKEAGRYRKIGANY